MSARMKEHHIKKSAPYIEIIIGIPGKRKSHFKIPNTKMAKEKLSDFLDKWRNENEDLITPWEQATPWEKIASDRLAHYKESGLALRGARFREGFSQKELAKRSGVSQDNISRMENGKRVIGEKIAKKLAKILHVDYRMFLT